MKAVWVCFVKPYWMDLLGVLFLAASIFFKGQWIVNVGFALLISGAIVSGVGSIQCHLRTWQKQRNS